MSHRAHTIALTAVLVLTTACSSTIDANATAPASSALATKSGVAATAAHGHGDSKLTADQLSAIAKLRNATARFHDLDVAKAAGYTSQYPAGCKATPDGAQGYHYLNPALVDEKTDILQPELVMYEPQKDGSLQLIGVDYIIPFDKWTAQEAPTILGVPMMRNEPLGVWALHIWAWRPNPSGMFAMWNPSASCQHAFANAK